MPEWVASTPWWVVVGLAIVLGTAGVKFVRWTGRVDTRLDNLDKRLDALAQTVQQGLAGVRAEIAAAIGQAPASTLARGSPIHLSDLGKKVSERIKAKDLASGLVAALRNRSFGESAYDVQEACFAYVKSEWKIPDEIDREIRDCAFENGIDRDQVLNVVAVELRDLILPQDAYS